MATVSDPWPPAFMRTAPPTVPGTPTAHSRPVRPADAVRRASVGQGQGRPGAHLTGPVEMSSVSKPAPERDGQTGEAGVGHQQVGAVAHHQDRHVQAAQARATSTRSASSSGSTPSAAVPPTR